MLSHTMRTMKICRSQALRKSYLKHRIISKSSVVRYRIVVETEGTNVCSLFQTLFTKIERSWIGVFLMNSDARIILYGSL